MTFKTEITLFADKDSCCGCGACENICPQRAIVMKPDTFGYIYPEVDNEKCVHCGLCTRVCTYKKTDKLKSPYKVYAATAVNRTISIKSASGGVFAVLAKEVIKTKGCVFGAAMIATDGEFEVKHIMVETETNLKKLQGSKYVQSKIGDCYREVKQQLINKRNVLFSGTPCQINGLYSYLGKEYQNLITVDIICHGVPNEQFYNDYIGILKHSNGEMPIDFKFRDKTKGWGLTAKYEYKTSNGKYKSRIIPFRTSSYYDMFIKCEIYRENCYVCPYACERRVGDITVGDFWGVERRHPDWMSSQGGPFSEENGISCILVNSECGKAWISKIFGDLIIRESTMENVKKENHQLYTPSKRPETREMILSLYKEQGYCGVERHFRKKIGIKRYYYFLKSMIPQPIKKIIKRVSKK